MLGKYTNKYGILLAIILSDTYARTTHEFTFASLDAFSPCMIEIWIASISAFLGPSTTISTTAKFIGFFDDATRGTWSTGDRFDYDGSDCRGGNCGRDGSGPLRSVY